MNTVWTGPDGFMTTNTAQPVMGSTTTYASTAIVSSFGRDQSGVYTCTATASPNPSMQFLMGGASQHKTTEVTTGITIDILTLNVCGGHITHFPGVYISHNGVFIEHDSSILITDIGTSSPHQLVCNTDRTPCCMNSRAGNWFYPDSALVMHTIASQEFGRDRSDNGEINLYRRDRDVMSPTGRFCCRVPDASDVERTVCVNDGE